MYSIISIFKLKTHPKQDVKRLFIMKKPIAMKCNQEQFDTIRPKLEKAGLKIKVYEGFEYFCYLCNPKLPDSIVGNYKWIDKDREVHETWNEKVFLEACGIEIDKEETFVITKDQIIEIHLLTCEFGKDKIKEWFPKAFEREKKELVAGRWYWYEGTLFNYQLGYDVYGFEEDGGWCNISSWKWLIETGYDREATEQEVFEALKKEAVKRGFVYGKNQYIKDLFNEDKIIETTQTGNFYMHDCESLSVGNMRILNKGKWAEIIPTISIKEAEERLNCKIV